MAEPISLADAKLWLKVENGAEDALITDLIVAAREWCERYTGHLLVQRQVTQAFDGFGPWLDLRAWPVVSIDEVAFTDRGFAAQTLAATGYSAGFGARPARIVARGYWPAAAGAPGSVRVKVTAGYAEGAVPATFKQAMRVLLWGMHENNGKPGDEAETAARSLLSDLRLRRV